MLETKTFRGLPISLSPALTEKAWSFKLDTSSVQTSPIFLSPSGRIIGHDNPQEQLWRIENHQILILADDATLTWQSFKIEYTDSGKLVIFLQNLEQNIFATLEEQQPASQSSAQTSPAELPCVESTALAALTDAEFLFPYDLERSPSIIENVLIIGSSIAALCHEQLVEQYPHIRFDFIPYEYVAPFPIDLDLPLEKYDFVYIQPSLRSIVGDDVVWGERFNTQGFAQRVLKNAETTLDQFIDHIKDYSRKSDTPLLISNFLSPQVCPVPCSLANDKFLSVSDIIYKLNNQLNTKLAQHTNTRVLDLDAVGAIIGKRYIQDDTVYFYTHNGIIFQDWDDFGAVKRDTPIPNLQTFYPNKQAEIGSLLFRQMIWGLRTLQQTDRVKAIIFGLDNIIWRGHLPADYQAPPPGFSPTRWLANGNMGSHSLFT